MSSPFLFGIEGQAVVTAGAGAWSMRLALSEPDIVRVSASIGRVGDVSAWAVAPGILAAPRIAVTNLAVTFPDGTQAAITEILNPADLPAISFLRIADTARASIELALARPESSDGQKAQAALVGYAPKLAVAPGNIESAPELHVDCATGGFLPGAPVVSLENGTAIGMWIGAAVGSAIEASAIRAALLSLGLEPAATVLESAELESVQRTVSDYAGRMGYDPNFLRKKVALPTVNNAADVNKWTTMGGAKRADLPYTNFTVVMSKSRKLPIYTVSNIDGSKSQELKRENDKWLLDPRIDSDFQAGANVYKGTNCDRGHMVRRLDPVWGRDALLANEDTFHYTNACPQHKNLNRKVWNDLEDYILKNTEEESIRVSVFTGPVFAKDDPPLHGVKVPVQYWKVAVMVTRSGKLSATGYVLSQAALMDDLELAAEFAFGAFKTFQVTIAKVEKLAGLDFGDLRNQDPFAKTSGTLESAGTAELAGHEDMILNHPLEVTMGDRAITAAIEEEPAAIDEWTNLRAQVQRLSLALRTFNRSDAEIVANELADDILRFETPMPDGRAPRLLQQLRGNCYFDLMEKVADALITTGQGDATVSRQYAQSLIDQGMLSAPRSIVKLIALDAKTSPREKSEAIGLNGRIFKQLYVSRRHTQENLQGAYESYLEVYKADKAKNLWHGINVVALAARAEADNKTLKDPVDFRAEAAIIRKTLEAKQLDLGDLDAWDTATALEACVALGDAKGATQRALDYIGLRDAGAFELASTTRQLEEIWRVGENPKLAGLIPILRSQTMKRDGASMRLTTESVRNQLSQPGLEKVFGPDGSKTYKWYMQGLERCKSVARIEMAGRGFGTGWLVRAEDFFPGEAGLLVLTNAHVIAPAGDPRRERDAKTFDVSAGNLQVLGASDVKFKGIRWFSPVPEFDATFLIPDGLPAAAAPLPISDRPVEFQTGSTDAPPRLYIIGHPAGRDLELALQDNYLLAMNERKLHYRTPTEPGNSGSPVFEANDWQVVALHHAGSRQLPKLDGSGVYEANEGISILALRAGIKARPAAV